MGEPPIENPLPRAWMRIFMRSLGLGVGIGIGICLVLVSMYFYMHRTKRWDTNALRVRHVKAESLTLVGDDLSDKSSGTVFTVDLENTTGTDIKLPQTLTVMQTVRQTGALHGSLLKLRNEYFIPAGHLVSVVLENDDLCAPNAEPQICFDTYFKDESEIVIFDEDSKYEIRVTIPAFTAPKNGSGPALPRQQSLQVPTGPSLFELPLEGS
jgi:hypothetical protein